VETTLKPKTIRTCVVQENHTHAKSGQGSGTMALADLLKAKTIKKSFIHDPRKAIPRWQSVGIPRWRQVRFALSWFVHCDVRWIHQVRTRGLRCAGFLPAIHQDAVFRGGENPILNSRTDDFGRKCLLAQRLVDRGSHLKKWRARAYRRWRCASITS
jgi:hypothetical protein